MSQKKPQKYSDITDDSEVGRWLRNLRRGSPITAEVAVRRLGRACELLSTDPIRLVQNARSDLRGFQNSLEDLAPDWKKMANPLGTLLVSWGLNLFGPASLTPYKRTGSACSRVSHIVTNEQ